MSTTVTIPLQTYLDLLIKQKTLQTLQRGGVDNWSGIDWAMENAPASLAALEELDGDPDLTLEMINEALKAK